MLPCFICGKDASTGWIKGFVPAPDSQKLALCAEHDNAANRLAVAAAWLEMLKKDIAGQMAVARYRTLPGIRTATVRFTAGGMLSFLCTNCTPTEQGTLRIDHPDGERTFIPMRHVREYSVRAYVPEEFAPENAPDAKAFAAQKPEQAAPLAPPSAPQMDAGPVSAGKDAAPFAAPSFRPALQSGRLQLDARPVKK